MSIRSPRPGQRDALVDSLYRFGAAMRGRPGLLGVHTLENARTGRLVGLVKFDSEDADAELLPLAPEAVADGPFDDWEAAEVDGLRLDEI